MAAVGTSTAAVPTRIRATVRVKENCVRLLISYLQLDVHYFRICLIELSACLIVTQFKFLTAPPENIAECETIFAQFAFCCRLESLPLFQFSKQIGYFSGN
jgi:hypothetical protein